MRVCPTVCSWVVGRVLGAVLVVKKAIKESEKGGHESDGDPHSLYSYIPPGSAEFFGLEEPSTLSTSDKSPSLGDNG